MSEVLEEVGREFDSSPLFEEMNELLDDIQDSIENPEKPWASDEDAVAATQEHVRPTASLPIDMITKMLKGVTPKFNEGVKPPEAPLPVPRWVSNGEAKPELNFGRDDQPQLANLLRRAKLLQAYDGTDVEGDEDILGESAQQAMDGKVVIPTDEFDMAAVFNTEEDEPEAASPDKEKDMNIECGTCFEETGSHTCVRPFHMEPKKASPQPAYYAEKAKAATHPCIPNLKSVEGRILTIMEVAFPDTTQRDAIKSLIKKEFRREMNKVNRTPDDEE